MRAVLVWTVLPDINPVNGLMVIIMIVVVITIAVMIVMVMMAFTIFNAAACYRTDHRC